MKIRKNFKEEKGLYMTIAVLIIVVIGFLVYAYHPKTDSVKQYSVDIVEITGNCESCFNISALTDMLEGEEDMKVKSVKTLDYDSPEAGKIIDEYNIKAVPAVVVLSKNIEKTEIDKEVFSVGDGYALFDRSVPYIDLETNEVKGLVNLKEIQSDNCDGCTPLANLETQFERLGIKIGDYEIIGSSSEKGQELIEKNNLTFTSSLLISKNIEEYWWIFDQMKDSLVEKEDNYLLKIPVAPYVNLTDGKIKGKVDVILLEDKSCTDCFDAEELKGSFMGLGVYFNSERIVEVSSGEGKNLLKKYSINAVPTVILSREIQDYSQLGEVLGQVGTIEDDGKFVFRNLDSLNAKYKEVNQDG